MPSKKRRQRAEGLPEVNTTNRGIADTTRYAVIRTARNPKINDFEDGLEYYSALDARCTCMITEDINDFYFSDIEVLT